MQRKLLQGFATLLIVGYLFLSCKKELSCQSCPEKNQPPVSNAGKDQTIALPMDSILLDGSLSSDPDGRISEWLWTKVGGPASLSMLSNKAAKAIVKNLAAGTYQFELRVTDDKGASATDTVKITLEDQQSINHPPIANAGMDTTITLPNNAVSLTGSLSFDPDNNITGYLWTKIIGPSSFTVTNPSLVQTPAINLVQGTYFFELKVTDAGGLFDRDTVQVTVMSVNQPPVCLNCKIVFVSDRDGNPEIYSCNADGSNISRLTNNAGTDDQPVWSPSGLHIAFVSDRSGQTEIYIMNADGSNVVRKTFSGNYSQDPTWSPDGTRIAYSTLSNGSANIWVVSATTGSPSLLFEKPGWEGQPSWSPDGTKMVLSTDWNAYDIVYDIFTINPDGTNFAALTGNIFDRVDYLYPSWSPNSTKIAVAISQNDGNSLFNVGVGIMNSNGGTITNITWGAAPWTRMSWSADGNKIAYTSLSGLSGSRKDVSWVAADASASGTIVTNGWNADWQH